MKFREWFKARSRQEVMMIVVITTLLIMIATRWAYISHQAGTAFRNRFVPPRELPAADSLTREPSPVPEA